MRKLSVALLVYVLCAMQAHADWSATNGPKGGSVRSLMVDQDGSLFCIVDNAIHEYVDGAWQRGADTEGRTIRLWRGMFFREGDIDEERRNAISYSLDNGRSWQLTTLPDMLKTSGDTQGGKFKMHALGDALFIASDDQLFRSTNGIDWVGLESCPETFASISNVFGNSEHVYGRHSAARVRGGVACRYDVNGDLLDRIIIPSRHISTYHYYFVGSEIMVLGDFFPAEISEDGGQSWDPVIDGYERFTDSRYPRIVDAAVLGSKLLLGTISDGLLLYEDRVWTRKSEFKGLSDLDVNNGQFIVAGSGGVFRSNSAAEDWEELDNGMNYTNVWGLLSVKETLIAQSISGVYRSSDDGRSWERLASNFHNAYVDNGTIYANVNAGPHCSDDRGKSWRELSQNFDVEQTKDNRGLSAAGSVSSYCHDGTYLYAGLARLEVSLDEFSLPSWVFGGVHRSADNGRTWLNMSTNLPKDHDGVDIPVTQIVTTNRGLLIATPFRFYISENQGGTWNAVNHSGEVRTVMRGLSQDPEGAIVLLNGVDRVFALVKTLESEERTLRTRVLSSADGGMTWSVSEDQLPAMRVDFSWNKRKPPLDILKGEVHLKVKNDSGWKIFRWDEGLWTDVSPELPDEVSVNLFVGHSDGIYAGTRRNGVWSDDPTVPTSIKLQPQMAEQLTAYPNPATSEVVIELPTSLIPLEVKLYDQRGVEVLRQIPKVTTSGAIRIVLPDGISAGMYLYHIKTSGQMFSGAFVRR